MAGLRKLRQNRAMALGFGIGSVLFGLGAVLSMAGVAAVVANYVYAIGAVGFTAAAAVQWRQAADARPAMPWSDPDWVASMLQFIGTLSFNVMTIRAVILASGAEQIAYQQVWRPDVFGSAMFLISSWMAWRPAVRRRRHEFVRGRSRLICVANMAGSVFFAISAWGAMLLPSGQLASGFWSSSGTLLGAIGFLIAAVALYPWRVGSANGDRPGEQGAHTTARKS